MKKKGITLTEILVAITIFSLGIVPLMLSLNSSFEATVFNRDYTKAMEYNVQLMEEIGTMMPTKVSKGDYSDLEALKSDVEKIIEARSEDKAPKKGIYLLPEWKGNRFDFSETDLIDNSMYRKIVVGDLESVSSTEVKVPIEIEAYNLPKDELIVGSGMFIRLKDEVKEDDNLIDSGDSGGTKIQIKGEERVPRTGSFKAPESDAGYAIVYLTGNGNNKNKVIEVDLAMYKNGVLGKRQPLNKVSDSKYSGKIILKAGEGFVLYLRNGNGTANLHEGLKYELYKNPPQ